MDTGKFRRHLQLFSGGFFVARKLAADSSKMQSLSIDKQRMLVYDVASW